MGFAFFQKHKHRPSKSDRSREIEIDGMVLPVKVVENDRAKRLTLRLMPAGQGLKVTLPSFVSDREIDEFLERNRNWVAARIARMPDPVLLEEGAVIPYRGLQHRVVYLDRLRGLVEAREVAGEPCLLVPGDPELIGSRLEKFLKKQARLALNEAVDRHAKALGVRPKSIRVTDTTSRWGSCSTTRTLSFSWRIIMAPPEVLDYLAAHEVAHLREMNHSDRFWAIVEHLCPDMKRQKSWLRHHGNALHAVRVA